MKVDLTSEEFHKSSKFVDGARDGGLTKVLTPFNLKNAISIF